MQRLADHRPAIRGSIDVSTKSPPCVAAQIVVGERTASATSVACVRSRWHTSESRGFGGPGDELAAPGIRPYEHADVPATRRRRDQVRITVGVHVGDGDVENGARES